MGQQCHGAQSRQCCQNHASAHWHCSLHTVAMEEAGCVLPASLQCDPVSCWACVRASLQALVRVSWHIMPRGSCPSSDTRACARAVPCGATGCPDQLSLRPGPRSMLCPCILECAGLSVPCQGAVPEGPRGLCCVSPPGLLALLT